MIKLIRRAAFRIPGITSLLKFYRYVKLRFYFPIFKDNEALFTSYYTVNNWNNEESFSGPGSTIEYTENIRKEITALLGNFDIEKILDAPCGDYNWFRLIPRDKHIFYIGGDIVEPLVKRNQALYKNENTEFIQLDITRDLLPAADLWICRDCLLHFSEKDIFRSLENLFRSQIPYFLTTTYPQCERNTNIPTGGARPLNLELPPFNFNKALLYLDDWIEGFPLKKLGLWERESLIKAFCS